MKLNILYEDNHIIVVIKPADVLSQAGSMQKEDMVHLLKDYIKTKYNKPGNVYLGLVHRLDLNVSGVMVFAKTSKAASRLSEQIRNKEFHKSYLAIVKGKLDSEFGKYSDYLTKNENKRQAFITDKQNGKIAELEYEVLEYKEEENISLVKVNLITGRFHQIRCQFAYHNHPLIGDTKYGDTVNNRTFFIGLYAYQLRFNHPTKKEELIFNKKPDHQNFLSFVGLDKINWR